MNGGCQYPGINGGEKLIAFETALIQAQIQMERSFISIAQSTGRPTVVVMDRGLLDVAAYLPADKWKEVLKANNLTQEYLVNRYDLVLHLVTAAHGAEKFYTTANNAARTETPQEARDLDDKIRGCYKGHGALKVVDNSSDFNGKMKRATKFVLDCVGGKA